MIEQWCIVKYENIKDNMYAVSNYGGLRNIKNGKFLHPWLGKNGYLYGTFMCKNNKPKSYGMHIIVARHFIDIPDRLKNINEQIVPNHKDFDRSNNIVSNLEWVTYAENNEYNLLNGHIKTCDDAPNAKVTNELVEKICSLLEKNFYNKEIINILDLPNDKYHNTLITRIRTGKSWKQISSKYKITNKNTLRGNYSDEFIDRICYMIEHGYQLKQMRHNLGIPDDKRSKLSFKNLVNGIRLRRSYKEISEKYTWYKHN